MAFFDLILACIIGGFVLFGLWFGLIHTLGSLLGTVLGVFLSFRVYEPFANWLAGITGWTGNFPKVLMFIISFIVINRLIGFIFFLIDKTFSLITKLPFINGLNRLLGGFFGFFEGVIVIGVVLFFIDKFPLSDQFMAAFATSKFAPFCIHTATVLWPLIPEWIRLLQDAVQGVF